MQTQEYTSKLVSRLHFAICEELGSSIGVFDGYGIVYEKSIAVFVLESFYGYQRRHMSVYYRIHEMYMPYCYDKILRLYLESECYRKMIMKILDVCDYGFKKVD